MHSREARRWASYAAIVYFTAMALALTFPGLRLFNTIRPFIIGIPFVFAWYLMWILGALVVFTVLHWVYSE
jgi:hypothetical protein